MLLSTHEHWLLSHSEEPDCLWACLVRRGRPGLVFGAEFSGRAGAAQRLARARQQRFGAEVQRNIENMETLLPSPHTPPASGIHPRTLQNARALDLAFALVSVSVFIVRACAESFRFPPPPLRPTFVGPVRGRLGPL